MATKKFVNVMGNEFPETLVLEKDKPVECKIISREVVKLKKYKTEKTVYRVEVDGEPKALWGSGQLDYLLNKVKDGDIVRITYLGKEKVKGFRNELHQYRVEVAE